MLHPNVLIGTQYTNFDFWYNGNSSNQLTLYQERSDMVTKLLDERWGHKPSDSVRNRMRRTEKDRDNLRVKTELRNPLGTYCAYNTYIYVVFTLYMVVGDEKWQDRPFWMRSAQVLDSVYPVLEKQAMNLYDLKAAEQDTGDLRFIWEKQEAYVETMRHTRDLQCVL